MKKFRQTYTANSASWAFYARLYLFVHHKVGLEYRARPGDGSLQGQSWGFMARPDRSQAVLVLVLVLILTFWSCFYHCRRSIELMNEYVYLYSANIDSPQSKSKPVGIL